MYLQLCAFPRKITTQEKSVCFVRKKYIGKGNLLASGLLKLKTSHYFTHNIIYKKTLFTHNCSLVTIPPPPCLLPSLCFFFSDSRGLFCPSSLGKLHDRHMITRILFSR